MKSETINIIYKLKEANGSNAKKSILLANKDNEEFTKFLYYLLNPFYTYKVFVGLRTDKKDMSFA